jgi:hypothetical protein
MSKDDLRTLRCNLTDGNVDVTGYLQFTKEELTDIGYAVLVLAERRPVEYMPVSREHIADNSVNR